MDGKAARVAETEAGAEGIKIASRAHVPALIKAVPMPACNHRFQELKNEDSLCPCRRSQR